jgi:hypothetical protein
MVVPEQQRLRGVLRGPELAVAIPQGDLNALQEVVEVCCDIWNGVGSLILPVDRRGRMTGHHPAYLQSRQAEQCLVHRELPENTYRSLRALVPQVSPFFADLVRQTNLHPLNLQPTYSGSGKQSLKVPTFRSAHLRRLSTVVWGRIDDEDRPEYEKGFEITETDAEDAFVALVEAQIDQISVQTQSAYLMGAYFASGYWNNRVVFVFNRASFNELVSFWNMRSRLVSFGGGARIVGLPFEALEIPAALAPLRRWVAEESYEIIKPDLELAPWGKRALEAAPVALKRAGFRQIEGLPHRSYAPENLPADRAGLEFGGFTGMSGPFNRGMHFDTVVALGQGDNLIRFVPPAQFQPRHWGSVQFDLTNLPLAFPLNDAAAARSHPNASAGIDGWTIRMANGGQPFDLPVRLPTAEEALEDFLSPHQLRAQLSQPGRYAQALLRRIGSVEHLAALASDESIQIIDTLTPRSAKKLAQYIRREVFDKLGGGIDDNTLEEILGRQELFLELPARTLSELAGELGRPRRDLAPALGRLVDVGLATRGASLRCPHCNYPDFFPLPELDERLVCRGCRLDFPLPVLDASGRQEQSLHYRLDGLMAQAMDQDLAPALLLLRRFVGVGFGNPKALYWPGLELYRGEAADCETEIDLLVANDGDVVLGECKRRAEGLSAEEVDRRAALAAEVGARPVFAALEGEFSKDTRAAVVSHGGYLLDRARLCGIDTGLTP